MDLMEFHISIFFIIEVIGTVAFASSGAMVAIKQQLDLLGVVVLGVTTAVGGGMLRDIILGNVPPGLFMNPVYVMAAFITVLALFIVVRLNQRILESRYIASYEKMMNIFDAIGLAAFTVTGIDTAVLAGYGDYHFLSVFLGVLTGVGAACSGISWPARHPISCASMYMPARPLQGLCVMCSWLTG